METSRMINIPGLASNSRNKKVVKVQLESSMEIADPISISSDARNRCAMGHFGWEIFHDKHEEIIIPYIYRATEKFCSVRMLEKKLLSKYLTYFDQGIYSCALVQTYYATACEGYLLTGININHSNNKYRADIIGVGDLLVRLNDAQRFYEFMLFCYRKLIQGDTNENEMCGFIRINKQMAFTYIVSNNRRLIPSFYFVSDRVYASIKKHEITGWDLIYLELCCRIQGVDNEIVGPAITAFNIIDIKDSFPKETIFEDYWPSVKDEHLFSSLVQPNIFNMNKIFIKKKIIWTKPPLEEYPT